MKIEGRAVPWNTRAMVMLERAARFDNSGGLQTLEEVVAGSQLVEIVRGESVVCCYAAKVMERDNGLEVVIVAAAGRAPGEDLTRLMYADVVRRFNVDAITVCTSRLGLVRKLARLGFSNACFTMRKMKCH